MSTVSHELKTPLTSIRMFGEMLQQGVAGGDREREARYHSIIVRESERGNMEMLITTPIRPLELMIGKAVPAVLIAYLNFLLMLSGTVFFFKVPMRGSLALLPQRGPPVGSASR